MMRWFLRRSRVSSSFLLLRWTFVVCSVTFVLLLQSTAADPKGKVQHGDEFEEFEVDSERHEQHRSAIEEGVKPKPRRRRPPSDGDDEEEAMVEEVEDEFARFENGEGYRGSSKRTPPPNVIPKVLARLIDICANYLFEILMATGIMVYFLSFFTGKSKNKRIATCWFNAHKSLLESNFTLVGDDGAKNLKEVEKQLIKKAEHTFTLWCSGRVGCEGMLVELKLLKRQNLISVIFNLIKSTSDQVKITVHMNPEDMDTFVFCLATKNAAARLSKKVTDLETFCTEKRSADKYGAPAHFYVMSEMAEVSTAMLDSKMVAFLNKHPDAVESIQFSDQYTGPIRGDDAAALMNPLQGRKALIFTFNISLKKTSVEEAVENMKPLMMLVFYCMDKVKRFRLTREAKNKAEKNRSKVSKTKKAQEEIGETR